MDKGGMVPKTETARRFLSVSRSATEYSQWVRMILHVCEGGLCTWAGLGLDQEQGDEGSSPDSLGWEDGHLRGPCPLRSTFQALCQVLGPSPAPHLSHICQVRVTLFHRGTLSPRRPQARREPFPRPWHSLAPALDDGRVLLGSVITLTGLSQDSRERGPKGPRTAHCYPMVLSFPMGLSPHAHPRHSTGAAGTFLASKSGCTRTSAQATDTQSSTRTGPSRTHFVAMPALQPLAPESAPQEARLYSPARQLGSAKEQPGSGRYMALETQPPLSIVPHNHPRLPTGPRGHVLEGSREAGSHLSPLPIRSEDLPPPPASQSLSTSRDLILASFHLQAGWSWGPRALGVL